MFRRCNSFEIFLPFGRLFCFCWKKSERQRQHTPFHRFQENWNNIFRCSEKIDEIPEKISAWCSAWGGGFSQHVRFSVAQDSMNLFGRLSARYNYRFPFRAFILLHHVAHTDLGQIRLLILLGSNRYPFVQKVTCLLWLLIKMEGLCALILRDSLPYGS